MANWLSQKKAERLFPQFEFVKELAGGGQKATFHVRSASMDDKMDDFCLKVLHPNYGDKERFNREVDLLSELPSHKNLTTLVLANTALVQGSRISFFCESMIFGKELQLPRLFSDKWTEAQCAEFFAQVCDGVEILSAKDIVHRDLKPANIIVKEDGTPVIVDLGIARGLNYSTLTDEYQPGTLAVCGYR